MAGNWEDRAAFCIVCGAGLQEREVFGALRKTCTVCDYIQFRSPACAAAAVVVRGREILLVRRGIEPYRGLWGFPAGFQDYWETPREAAVREVLEETGMEIEVERLLDVRYTRDDPRKRANVVVYLARAVAGTLRASDDADDAAFFSLDRLPEGIAFENNQAILRQLMQDFPTGDIDVSDQPSAYRDAGVDIDAKYQAVKGSTEAIRSTFTDGVVGDVGQFGGVFDLSAAGAAGSCLVASVDGVGTKVMVARQAGRLGGVGSDLVNHCVNDILVQGARPLFFLDYVAVAKMVPDEVSQVIGGVAAACRENGCALLGGETAEMPGVYRDGELDLAGTIVGAVERDRMLDGGKIAAGDSILALCSSGLHTNGYSLARKVVADLGVALDDRPDELEGASVADALLEVHRTYYPLVWPLLERDLVHGLVHVTGGGLYDNVPRVLPKGAAVRIETEAMPCPPIFRFLTEGGKIAHEEAYRVFNMGFGLLLFVASSDVEAVRTRLREAGEESYVVGEVVAGAGEVVVR